MKLKHRVSNLLIKWAGKLSEFDLITVERGMICPECMANAITCFNYAGIPPTAKSIKGLASWMHSKEADPHKLASAEWFSKRLACALLKLYSDNEKYERCSAVRAAMNMYHPS